MGSKIITLRLNQAEQDMLAKVCHNPNGDLNPSELLRLLLHREFTRRTTGKSVVPERAISSEWRNGRPPGQKPG